MLMLCYAMLCSSNRSRSQDASALRPPRISDRRSKMNVRRPQEIQHERQEAPAGPKVSARRLRRELSGAVESRQEPPGAVGSRQEPARRAARSRQEPPGRLGSCQELTQKPPGAVGSRQEPARRAARSRREPSGARLWIIENRALRAACMILTATVGPLWGSEIKPELRS